MLRGCERTRAKGGEEAYRRRRRGGEPSRAVLLSAALTSFWEQGQILQNFYNNAHSFSRSVVHPEDNNQGPPKTPAVNSCLLSHGPRVPALAAWGEVAFLILDSCKNSEDRRTGPACLPTGQLQFWGSNLTRMRRHVVADSRCLSYISQGLAVVTSCRPDSVKGCGDTAAGFNPALPNRECLQVDSVPPEDLISLPANSTLPLQQLLLYMY